MLAGAGEHVEQGGLAAVLLAGKGKTQHGVFRQGVLVVLGVILTAFAKARVGVVVVQPGIAARFFLTVGAAGRDVGIGYGLGFDSCRVRLPESQCVAVDLQLDRIAGRGPADHLEHGSRNEPHVKEMHAGSALAAHADYSRVLIEL